MQTFWIFVSLIHLSGLEWAGGLPGTVGGAIRGNAGAFGGETKDSIKEVTQFKSGYFDRKNPGPMGMHFRLPLQYF